MGVVAMRTLCLCVYLTELFWVLTAVALFSITNLTLTSILYSIESQTEISDNTAIADFSAWVDNYKTSHGIYENTTLFQEIDDACESATTATDNWSMGGSSFFLVTVATTIGYGNYTPTSLGAQLLITIFCTPLFLLMLKTYLLFSQALLMGIKMGLANLCCATQSDFLERHNEVSKKGFLEIEMHETQNRLDKKTDLDDNESPVEEFESAEMSDDSICLTQAVALCSAITKVDDDDSLDPELMHKLLELFPTSDAKVDYESVKNILNAQYTPEDRIKKILKKSNQYDRITLPLALSLALVYLLLTAGIQSANANANNIDLPYGFWTAMWYSIITTTTIGLGDYTPQSFGEKHFNALWLYLGLGFVFLVVDLLTDILGRCTKRMYTRFKNVHFLGNIKAIIYQDAT